MYAPDTQDIDDLPGLVEICLPLQKVIRFGANFVFHSCATKSHKIALLDRLPRHRMQAGSYAG